VTGEPSYFIEWSWLCIYLFFLLAMRK